MVRKDLTAKKERWSSNNVVVIRRRPKAKAKPVKQVKEPKPKAKPAKQAQAPVKVGEDIIQLRKSVRADLDKILTEPPYKIGIAGDLFEALKVKYTGQRKKLRRTIKYHLKRRVKTKSYLKALAYGKVRTGLDGDKYPISDENRQYALEILKGKK